ncbi:excinuclease ABC subunit B [Erythrobacter sp. NAP1]|uniref:DUF3617 domain-containing protein n=1 Tax=Erythrobacter sp. NAP1 TaxID=237727 RepID=UPI00006851CA|nr:DUF3617 domain-containing protein [Erythrobacter sp. NAP1]EAQ27624.1 excinuclease ABC subunit B [Erythrobacter sp. NAP1]
MKNAILAASAVFMLTACGGATDADADGDGTITQKEVQAAMGDVSISPGQWENTVEFVDISFDETKVPEEARGMLTGMLEGMKGQINTTQNCVTPEEAEKPAAEMFSGNENADCEYNTFEFGGGTMNMEMTCQDPSSGTAKITNTGTYSDDAYEMDMTVAIESPEMGTMTIAASSKGKLIGECPAE